MASNGNMTNGAGPKYMIFDTDMGSDDAFALQMLMKAEKSLKNIKILAITAVNGNTTVENVIKNTYRILDGLERTDVKYQKRKELLVFLQLIFMNFLYVLTDSNSSRCNRRFNSW